MSCGGPLDRSRVSRAWRALLAEQGIRPLRLHDLRHGLATLYRELGADLRTIQDQLGHSSLRVTSDLYTARVMVPLRDAAERLERALSEPREESVRPDSAS